MLKIEFNEPQKIPVGFKKVWNKADGVYHKVEMFENTDVVFANWVNRDERKNVIIMTIKGLLFSYNSLKGNRIKSILPFNENQTKQFKIV